MPQKFLRSRTVSLSAIVRQAALACAASVGFIATAQADTISYYLDRSDELMDGVNDPQAGSSNEFPAAHVAGFSGSGETSEASAYFAGTAPVPLPAAVWLLGSALVCFGAISHRRSGARSLSTNDLNVTHTILKIQERPA